jgi:glutathione S-transferase
VARRLRAEEIAFETVVVPQRRGRRPEVEALTSQQRVPTVILDGEVICDSSRIIGELDRRSALAEST